MAARFIVSFLASLSVGQVQGITSGLSGSGANMIIFGIRQEKLPCDQYWTGCLAFKSPSESEERLKSELDLGDATHDLYRKEQPFLSPVFLRVRDTREEVPRLPRLPVECRTSPETRD